jgi:hypothetical protein
MSRKVRKMWVPRKEEQQAQMIIEDVLTAEERLAFAQQELTLSDWVIEEYEAERKEFSATVKLLRKGPREAGRKGGLKKGAKRRDDTVRVEKFLEERLQQEDGEIKNSAVVDAALPLFEKKSNKAAINYPLSRGTIEKYLKRVKQRLKQAGKL